MRSSHTLTPALALSLFQGADAFWRMGCGIIQTGRVDPIITPGAISGHVHTLVGGSNIGIGSTGPTLSDSPCTSCEIQADKSAYWSPQLFYNYENGSFIEVPHGGSTVYYLGRGVGGAVAFPPGFQMVSGNPFLRSYDDETMTWGNSTYPSRPVADRVTFACLTAGPSPPEQHGMFTPTQCVNGMRAQIAFPSCWNGEDLYKPDGSHVAYLSQIDNGACPPTHPVYLPTLFMETLYSTDQVPRDGNSVVDSGFVFAQGDPTGFGFHGDFMNGWDQDVLTDAVENCLFPDNFGQISYCPALYASDTNGAKHNCPEQPAQIKEKVHGLLDSLPGCNDITYGPEAASFSDNICGAGAPAPPAIASTTYGTSRPTASPAPGASFGLPSQKYLGCFNDTGSPRTLNAVSTSDSQLITVEYCQKWCNDQGYRLSGLEYGQECHCDNHMNPTAIAAEADEVNQCTWVCSGTLYADFDGEQQLCGGLSHIDVYNNTDPNFNNASGDDSDSAGNSPEDPLPSEAEESNYVGCYTDIASKRTLSGSSTRGDDMTVEKCANFCSSANGGLGYKYYGLEYFSECYCGNTFTAPNQLLTPTSSPPNSTCSYKCKGDDSQICGGSNALSVYTNPTYQASSEVAFVTTNAGQYKSQHCLTEPGSGGRALQGASTTSQDMTVELCVNFCSGKSMKYAGVEYARECYCDKTIANPAATLEDCPVGKMMLCPGNETQYCGGPSLLNLYLLEN